MNKPLKGIKVVDLCLAGAGPSCTKILTEYGADTIWIEPLGGTSTRSVFKSDFYTTGKQAITLNLKTPEGKEIINRLIMEADIFVSNYRPNAIKRLGLDYDALHDMNPRLIYATISGYGEEGEYADKPGYDPVAFWAKGGLLHDYSEKGALFVPPIAVGDITAGIILAGGITTALYNREKTGEGCKVFTSLLGTAMYLNHDAIVELQYGEKYPKSRNAPRHSLCNNYRCKDDKWITLSVFSKFDEYFWNILKVLGREDLVGNPRWTCLEDTMHEHAPEVVSILDEAFSKITQAEALELLESIDVPVSKVQTTAEAMNDPQVWANNYLYRSEATTPPPDSKNGTLILPANPIKFDNINSGIHGHTKGPKLGEHSIAVLNKYGYSQKKIQEMLDKKIISSQE